jgi:hypothetical protein
VLEALKQILVVNAYWFSLPISGYGIILALKQRVQLRPAGSRAVDFVMDQSFIGTAFISCAFSFTILAVWALFCYLIHAPVWVMSVFYVLTLVIGAGYLIFVIAANLFNKRVLLSIPEFKDQPFISRLVFLGMLVLLTGDFAFNMWLKSYALNGGDTFLHLARMVTILARGFTINSGYFGNLVETGYHYNVVYALYVVPAQLFHLQPSTIWEYSAGFFRLLQWAAIFTLAWHICTVWLKDKVNALLVSSLATIFAVSYYGALFFIALYPDQLVVAWMILLVMTVSFYEQKPKASFLPSILVAFLIAMTHPTYAFMCAAFLGLAGLIKIILQWKDRAVIKQTLYFYLSLIVILMVSPVRTELYPQRFSANIVNFGNIFQTMNFGSFSISRPYAIWHNPLIQMLLFGISTFGMWFIFYRTRKAKGQWPIVVSLIVFFPLLAYVPFTFSVLRLVLPLWVISRFGTMNILGDVAVVFGLYGLLYACSRWGDLQRNLPSWLKRSEATALIGVVIVLGLSAYYILPTYHKMTPEMTQNSNYYSFMNQTYTDFHSVMGGEKTVVASSGDSYVLSAVLPVYVIAIEVGHTAPTADAPDRQACQTYLMNHFDYADLQAVKASYVTIATYDPHFVKERAEISSDSYLHLMAHDSNFLVYSFIKQPAHPIAKPDRACTKYQQVEAS